MSPSDPVKAATAVARLQTTQARFREVQEERRQAILEAVRAEVPLREVAQAADCSHESIRRIVASDGAVMVEVQGASFQLTGQQVEMLIYKLSGSAQGAFPKDMELLGVGTDWLPAAGELAHAFQVAMADEEGHPLVLDDNRAFALYQILRLTYFGGLTNLARLFEVLHQRIEDRGPHIVAAMTRERPRRP